VTEERQLTWQVRPVVGLAVLVGVASLIANVVWNCNSCGWDLDGVPWYQAVLVAAVPYIVTPLGIVALAIRAIWLRDQRALSEFGKGAAGLALPWLYFLVAYFLYGFPK
jgi:hypothetical protein